jgi:hypothetical protein
MHNTLAIHGGPKTREALFPAHVTVGAEEKAAVMKVIDSGILSNYLGAYHENFMGGAQVRECEALWCQTCLGDEFKHLWPDRGHGRNWCGAR